MKAGLPDRPEGAPHGLGQRGWTGALNPVYRMLYLVF